MWSSAAIGSAIATDDYLPITSAAFDLGSSTKLFRDLYLSRNLVGSSSITLAPRNQTPRRIVIDAASDTSHTMLYGDASTNSQTFTIGSVADGAAESRTLYITAHSSANVSGGAQLSLTSNSGGGDAVLASAVAGVVRLQAKGNGSLSFFLDGTSSTDWRLRLGNGTANCIYNIYPQVDSSVVRIGAGSAISVSQGAHIILGGNTNATYLGDVILQPGNGASGLVRFRVPTGLDAWYFSTGGNLVQTTSGQNILLATEQTAVCQPKATGLVAAGTTISDALQLTRVFNNVTSVSAGTGVKLWSTQQGVAVYVRNAGANTLKVYPPTGAGTINGGSAGASVDLPVNTTGVFVEFSSNVFTASEMPDV